MEELLDEISEFETRVRPEESKECLSMELDYGWQAVLYEATESLIQKSLRKIHSPFTTEKYRTRPEYEWELKVPNVEVYRARGLDLGVETFEKMVENFLE